MSEGRPLKLVWQHTAQINDRQFVLTGLIDERRMPESKHGPPGQITEPGLQTDCFFHRNLSAMNYTKIKNWLQFLTVGIWRITEDEVSPIRRQLYSCIKIVYLSVDQFLNDRIQIRASALTYSTLLSIIPILAILFAIARGFGFDTLMEIQLRQGVASQQSELIIRG